MQNTYRGVVISDHELKHWKYIKRERGANGKWRYYYNVGQKEQTTADEAYKRMNAAKDMVDIYQKQVDAYSELNNVQSTVGVRKALEANEKILEEYVQEYVESKKDYESALKAFGKTPLGKLNKLMTLLNSFTKSRK